MLGFVKNNWFFQQDRIGKYSAGPPPPNEEALPPQITTFDAQIIPNGHPPLQKPVETKPEIVSASLPAVAPGATLSEDEEEEETSSVEEDRMEYGPGIVARLRQKFLAFATHERARTAVKRRKARAQSCDDLLDDERASQISYENVRQMTKLSQSQTALHQQGRNFILIFCIFIHFKEYL